MFLQFINDCTIHARQGEPNRKRFPLSGRLILHYGRSGSIHFEYNIKSTACHLSFDVGEDYTISIALSPIALYFSFGNGRYKDKELRVSIYDWSIWWNFWTGNMEWNSNTPKYRNGSFHILDFLFGEPKYSKLLIEERKVSVPMPEGTYQATAKLEEATWKRPRWFPIGIGKRNHQPKLPRYSFFHCQRLTRAKLSKGLYSLS